MCGEKFSEGTMITLRPGRPSKRGFRRARHASVCPKYNGTDTANTANTFLPTPSIPAESVSEALADPSEENFLPAHPLTELQESGDPEESDSEDSQETEAESEDSENSFDSRTPEERTLQTLASALSPLLKLPKLETPGVNRDEVRAIVRETLAEQTPSVYHITFPNSEVREISGPQHSQFATLVKCLGMGQNVYLTGPSQSGKSKGANLAAQALGREFEYISLNPQTPDSRIMGFIRPDGQFQDTGFYRRYVYGGIFCIDEVDNTSDSLLTTLNSAFANGIASFPCGMVQRHPDFLLIVTGNTNGATGGTRDYPDRRILSSAFRNRFVFIRWDYDEELERNIVMGINSQAIPLMRWVQEVRRNIADKGVRGVLATPTQSFRFAQMLGGFELETLADMLVFTECAKDVKEKILREVPLPRLGVAS